MPNAPFRRNPELQFEYILARELGMTHGELCARMSTAEFAYWVALYKLEQPKPPKKRK